MNTQKQLSAVTPRDELRLSDQDAAHEATIKHHGDQMAAKFDEWARTGSPLARTEMDKHFDAFKSAVAARSPEAWAIVRAKGVQA